VTPFGREAGSPSRTMWPGPSLRSSSMPRAILIHPAVWPQWTWAENRGALPLFWIGELGPHLTQYVALGEAYLSIKWHLDPCSHLATTDMCRKLGAVSLGRGGADPQSPSKTICGQGRGPWPTCVPSFIWIGPTSNRLATHTLTLQTDSTGRTEYRQTTV